MHTQSKPGPVFEQKLCQDILHQNAHGWINIDLGVCGRNLGLRLQPLVGALRTRDVTLVPTQTDKLIDPIGDRNLVSARR